MQEFKDWNEFINRILIDSGQFNNTTSEFKGTTHKEIFKSTDKNSLTEIRVGYYIEVNKLIYLHVFNPKIPGYNKYVEGEYFYQHHFSDDGKTYGNPGLEFNKLNQRGIISILKSGLKGREVQFLKNGKVLKSKLYIRESHPDSYYTYNFINRTFLSRIFERKIDKMKGIEKKEIILNTIFVGIKNIFQQNV